MTESAPFSESRFWTHIVWILVVKLIAISTLWWFCFGPATRVKPDAALMQYHLTEGKNHD